MRAFRPDELSRCRAMVSTARARLRRIHSDDIRAGLAAELDRIEAALATVRAEGPAAVGVDIVLRLINKFVTNRQQARELAEAVAKLSS